MNISNYTPICNAIVSLLKPLVEIAIHDIKTNKIIFIEGSLSNRKIGDQSLIDINIEDLENKIDQVIYPKLNFDGRLIKSITLPIKENNKTKALICINCDISIFNQMHNLSQAFLPNIEQRQPKSLFKNDCQERIHIALYQALETKDWDFESLSIKQKKELAYQLFIDGAFAEKNSANYIAKILDMGRTTLFKYLKEWRN